MQIEYLNSLKPAEEKIIKYSHEERVMHMRNCMLNGLIITFKPKNDYYGNLVVSYNGVEYKGSIEYKNFRAKMGKNDKHWGDAVMEEYTKRYLKFKDSFEKKIEVGGVKVNLEIEVEINKNKKNEGNTRKIKEGNTRRIGDQLISGNDY